MKTFIKSLFILIPILFSLVFINCNKIDESVNSGSTNSTLDNNNTTNFVVHLKIIQKYHHGGDYVIVDDSRNVSIAFIDENTIDFYTLGDENGKESCDFIAECYYEWNNYDWGPIAYVSQFYIPLQYLYSPFEVIPVCPEIIPGHFGPCSSSAKEIVYLSLEKNTQYNYKLGLGYSAN